MDLARGRIPLCSSMAKEENFDDMGEEICEMNKIYRKVEI